MELQLKRIREAQGIKQSEMARMVSALIGKEIKVRTYGSWERCEVTMDLEQAYYCALALGCTIDEIAGRQPRPRVFADPDQQQLNEQYEELNATGRRKAVGSVEDIHANPANLKSEQPGRQPVPGDPRRETKSA